MFMYHLENRRYRETITGLGHRLLYEIMSNNKVAIRFLLRHPGYKLPTVFVRGAK